MTDLGIGRREADDLLTGSQITLMDLLRPAPAEVQDPSEAGVRDARAVLQEVRAEMDLAN